MTLRSFPLLLFNNTRMMKINDLTVGLNKTCPVCLEELGLGITSELDTCSHSLCEACFNIHVDFSNKCPLCSQVFKGCSFKSGSSVISTFVLTEENILKREKNRRSLSEGSKLFIKTKHLIVLQKNKLPKN